MQLREQSLSGLFQPEAMLLAPHGKWLESTHVCSGVSRAQSSTKRLRCGSHPVTMATPVPKVEAAGWDLPLKRRDRWTMQTDGVSGQ